MKRACELIMWQITKVVSNSFLFPLHYFGFTSRVRYNWLSNNISFNLKLIPVFSYSTLEINYKIGVKWRTFLRSSSSSRIFIGDFYLYWWCYQRVVKSEGSKTKGVIKMDLTIFIFVFFRYSLFFFCGVGGQTSKQLIWW